ncbi:MAG: hypothetical protein KJO69_01215 [Gammaproteobacteria bacterium]|nr:hypothetical protein [Gammaproteobacteria bacterium]NNJ73435.1 hypothetical protein [Enterobacterales bacterium]
MPINLSQTLKELQDKFGDQHAQIYELIAREDQVMSTYGLECATEIDSEIVALCLGDLVRSNYIKVFDKHNRRPAWEIVKDVAKAS